MKINSKTKQLNKKKRNESRETRTETMGVRSGSVRESRKGGGGGSGVFKFTISVWSCLWFVFHVVRKS